VIASEFSNILRTLTLVSLLTSLSLAGCQVNYIPDVTPVAWSTPELETMGIPQLTEVPYPTSTSPFEVPSPNVFHGIDSLNCIEPHAGDLEYGYCRIPGTFQYYIWGQCTTPCPESPYLNVEVLLLDDSFALQNYKEVIDKRERAFDDRVDKTLYGGVFGTVGLAGGIVGVGEACFVSGSWNGGTGCIIVLGALGVDGLLTYINFKKGHNANNDLNRPNGLNDSAEDIFELIRQLEASE